MAQRSDAIKWPDTKFWKAYRGKSIGLLRWPDMAALFEKINNSPDGWYGFDLNEDPPNEPLAGDDFIPFIDRAKRQSQRWHERGCLGFIYVDSRDQPAFVKIFDPDKMGTACGSSGEPVWPRWVLSRVKPEPLPSQPDTQGITDRLKRIFAIPEQNP